MLGGFEEIHVISVYGMQNNEKVIYSMYIFNENDFFKVLSSIDLNFVFYKTKLINKEGKEDIRLGRFFRRDYVRLKNLQNIVKNIDLICNLMNLIEM